VRLAALVIPLSVCAAVGATAQDIQMAGIAVADHAAFTGQKLLLNGAGVRTMFGFRVYVASLYLPEPMREATRILDGNMPRRLQIVLLRDTSTDQNLDALKGGLYDNNSAAELDAIKGEVALFFTLINQVREVPAGTVMQLDYLPGAGTLVKTGARTLGMVPGERFNRAILKIWLGGEPIQPSLKKALLGLGGPTL
jgi:hypothetical protein